MTPRFYSAMEWRSRVGPSTTMASFCKICIWVIHLFTANYSKVVLELEKADMYALTLYNNVYGFIINGWQNISAA